jgi:2-methylcitrate dehydratase PrpD
LDHPVTEPTVVQALAEVALTARAVPLSDELAAAAQRAVIDWLGAALGGSLETPARALIEGLTPLSGPSRLLADPQTAPAPIAALVNGTAAHTLELDDIYAPGLFHPGAPVIAAALAVADQTGAGGEAFLRAVATGYEVGCRAAEDLGPSHYARWHTTGTAGSLAAAAAAAELLAAGPDAFANALALAATMAGGLQQTFRGDAMGKPLHAGNAAQAGVVAAIAALGGVTGAPDVLEGEAGLGAATGAPSAWACSRAPASLRPAITAVTVKPYPCCGHAFAVIDAVLRLRAEGLCAADVRHLDVHTYRTALQVAGITDPRTGPERKFSIPYLAAAALLTGEVGDTSTAADPAELRRLMGAVRLHPDPAFEAVFPARRGARVSVVTQKGATLAAEVPDRSGSPQNPLSDDRVEQKFLATSAAALAGHGPEVLRQLKRLRCGGTVADLPMNGETSCAKSQVKSG